MAMAEHRSVYIYESRVCVTVVVMVVVVRGEGTTTVFVQT